jgi:hypothetical protein
MVKIEKYSDNLFSYNSDIQCYFIGIVSIFIILLVHQDTYILFN